MRPRRGKQEPGACTQRQQEKEQQQKATQADSGPFAGQSKHSVDCSLHCGLLWLSSKRVGSATFASIAGPAGPRAALAGPRCRHAAHRCRPLQLARPRAASAHHRTHAAPPRPALHPPPRTPPRLRRHHRRQSAPSLGRPQLPDRAGPSLRGRIEERSSPRRRPKQTPRRTKTSPIEAIPALPFTSGTSAFPPPRSTRRSKPQATIRLIAASALAPSTSLPPPSFCRAGLMPKAAP